jgi:hypothetical protein
MLRYESSGSEDATMRFSAGVDGAYRIQVRAGFG